MHLTERLPRETGRDFALRIIKDNIVRLELAPGSMVSENELAAEMGLSRTPVREALIELAKVKIVEIYPQRGSTVSLIDYDLVDEARFIRKVLECAVVELDCEMATPAGLRKLQENVQLQRFYYEQGNFYTDALMDLDNQFHTSLFEIAHKPQAYALMNNIAIHFDRVRSMALSTVKDVKIVEDHAQLVEHISRGESEQARQTMELHLSRYKFDAKALRERYPQYFK